MIAILYCIILLCNVVMLIHSIPTIPTRTGEECAQIIPSAVSSLPVRNDSRNVRSDGPIRSRDCCMGICRKPPLDMHMTRGGAKNPSTWHTIVIYPITLTEEAKNGVTLPRHIPEHNPCHRQHTVPCVSRVIPYATHAMQ